MSDQAPTTAEEMILVDVADIRPYARNPRVITEADVDSMAALIKAHGFRVPILVRSGDAVWELVDGHLRIRAAQKLGIVSVPAIDVSDLSEEQIAAFRISVNRAAEIASWDPDLLMREISDIRAADEALFVTTGFDDAALSALLGQDTGPMLPPEPVVSPGETVTRSADRRTVTSPQDRVSLTVAMTVEQRTTVLARLDAHMAAHSLSSRAEALIALVTAQQEEAPRAARTRRSKA